MISKNNKSRQQSSYRASLGLDCAEKDYLEEVMHAMSLMMLVVEVYLTSDKRAGNAVLARFLCSTALQVKMKTG